MRTSILTAVLVALLSACTASYNVQSLSGQSNRAALDRSAAVFVAVPKDGVYESTNYPGSGQTVTEAVAAAFSTVAPSVTPGEQVQSLEKDFSAATNAKATYLVVPLITHWEQRATQWSGIPSRMTIRLSVYNVKSKALINATLVEGRSRIMSFTSTSPESLLRDPLKGYVNKLYGLSASD